MSEHELCFLQGGGNEVYVYVRVYKCCYKILIPSLSQHIPCEADLQPPLLFYAETNTELHSL